jgi:hypothetical protein
MTPVVPEAAPEPVVVLEYSDLAESSTSNVDALLAALEQVLLHWSCLSIATLVPSMPHHTKMGKV